MKLGFVSALFGDLILEEVVEFASSNGYRCIEVCCWPNSKAEQKFSGVSHIDVASLDKEKADIINNYFAAKGVEISALGYYPNPLDPDEGSRNFYISHIMKVIDASVLLGINRINTFIGRDHKKSIDENFEIFGSVWKPLIQYAESRKVKVGIENCPMLFSPDQWPGGNNLATTPAIWRRMFSEIPCEYFGLNYDPSHLLWLQIDYLKPLYEFRDKIFHVHLKDAVVNRDKLEDIGIMAMPGDFHSAKIPGNGDINWGKFFSALNDIKYQGAVCVEVEDRAFEGELENRKNSLIISRRYLSQYI